MDTISYKTKSVNKENAAKKWYVIDANGHTVGRLSSMIAYVLRGKHKPSFTPHSDCGDYVIVINADKVIFSGNKSFEKEYVSYTNYPGGQRFTTPEKLSKDKPEVILEKAIKGMLPKNVLGREVFRNVFVYSGENHPHEAQKPEKFNLNTLHKI